MARIFILEFRQGTFGERQDSGGKGFYVIFLLNVCSLTGIQVVCSFKAKPVIPIIFLGKFLPGMVCDDDVTFGVKNTYVSAQTVYCGQEEFLLILDLLLKQHVASTTEQQFADFVFVERFADKTVYPLVYALFE